MAKLFTIFLFVIVLAGCAPTDCGCKCTPEDGCICECWDDCQCAVCDCPRCGNE